VDAACDNGADYLGFVFFAPSVRNISANDAKILIDNAASDIEKVGVFVNPEDNFLDEVLSVAPLDIIQLHGTESHERVVYIKKKYGKKIIKAAAIRDCDDIVRAKGYSDISDMLLFDAKVPSSEVPGGNGVSFDWELLSNRKFDLPWFLSGGINIDNVIDALNISHAKMVDVSSSLESKAGIKDVGLIKEFLHKVKISGA
ncbi:phosphoribosylanthranilate isomerase, partial [Rickettsiales bacterium]|nr:phosphoribosylanthranilate isomerase [Rickettsiales bacterium]